MRKTINTDKGPIIIETDGYSATATNSDGKKVGEIKSCDHIAGLDLDGNDEYGLLLNGANVDEDYRLQGIAEACIDAICEESGRVMLANMNARVPQENGSHLTSAGRAMAERLVQKGKMFRMDPEDTGGYYEDVI